MEIKLSAFADEADPSLDGQIKALKKNNIKLLEIRGVDGKNILDLTDDEAKAAFTKLTNNGIKVWSIGSPIGKVDINTNFEEYKKKVIRACELANIFQCQNIRMFSFFKAYNEKNKVIQYLKEMVAIANKYGVKMCHENEKEIYGDIEPRCTEILNAVDGLYYVYDPANFLQCKQDPRQSLKMLAPRAHYYHIKDAIMATGEVVPPGKGEGLLQELVNQVKGDKVFTIEPHLKVFAGYSNMDNTELKNKCTYNSNEEAFDAAVSHAKQLLKNAGFHEVDGGFSK